MREVFLVLSTLNFLLGVGQVLLGKSVNAANKRFRRIICLYLFATSGMLLLIALFITGRAIAISLILLDLMFFTFALVKWRASVVQDLEYKTVVARDLRTLRERVHLPPNTRDGGSNPKI